MIPIAECKGVRLYGNERCFFSFTNSPYYGHKHLASIDLYTGRKANVAYSPVEGKVIEARKLQLMDDYIIAIKVEGFEACVKILHAKPKVMIGERLSPGDIIGELVWSPFYDFWTDPHIHIEVRPPNDWLRAKGAYTLDPKSITGKMRLGHEVPRSFVVEKALDRYVLLRPSSPVPPFTTPLIVSYEGVPFVLEGGIPHYGHGALWNSAEKLPERAVERIKRSLAVDFTQEGYSHFTFATSDIVIKGCRYLGVGLYLNDPHVKLIPQNPGESGLEVGEEIQTDEILAPIKRRI